MKKLFYIILLVGIVSNCLIAQCHCCGSSSGFSGGETTPGTFALKKKQLLSEVYGDIRVFKTMSNFTNAADQNNLNNPQLSINNMLIGIMGLRYGLSNKITLLIQQPYFWINATPSSSKTLGDLLTMANFVIVEKPSYAIALQGGMEWPTGQYAQISNGSNISTGSGSFDPVAGANVMKRFKKSSLRLGAFFKYTTKGFNETYFGNFFGQQLNYSYFLISPKNACVPDSLSKKKNKTTLSLNAQLSGEWSQAQLKNHGYVPNTGAYIILGGLGTTLVIKKISIPILVSMPMYQHFHGDQSQQKFRIRIGITKTFN